ncbi:CAZyme family AA5 [Agaricus bisporus var. burnettii]|uniref:CAZyme family AA5 n=1 Tax=Agaricus bisporus var. burnettii TaxID=192524 RepID=A0A8H7KIR0_AGABI|nr:CAZyme family AA5 [Agaricus bisporus var. burnettii]
MARLYTLFLSFFFLFLVVLSVYAQRDKWNRLAPFKHTQIRQGASYYPGKRYKTFSSDSPLIKYEGTWSVARSRQYDSGALHITHQRGAALSFNFSGTGIVWLGNCDRFHGYAQVILDDEAIGTVDLSCDVTSPLNRRKLFETSDLDNRPHTIKLINLGSRLRHYGVGVMDIDTLVVVPGKILDYSLVDSHLASSQRLDRLNLRQNQGPGWKLTRRGMSGVAAMQLAIVSPTLAIIIDKVERNPLTVDGHPAWAALYNLDTQALTPLRPASNSFCAGGAFLSNGTLVNAGGNAVVQPDFGDVDGSQGIRLFHPCNSADGEGCEIYEDPKSIKLASPRWYTTVLKIQDGSVMILGGSRTGGFINDQKKNNPTLEYFPRKSIHGSGGSSIHLKFLEDTLNSNLFPIAFLLPTGNIFIAANNDAMIYDWQRNTEERLPSIPNGVRVTYPMSGVGLLLPLSYEDDYKPEILLCGGSTLDDRRDPKDYSSQEPASKQCSIMVVTEQGIARGWQVEEMPEARIMPDGILLPTGQVLILNGAQTGVGGYGNAKDQIGQSNADNPAFTPIMYDPQAPVGRRFYRDSSMPTSSIARLYHSSAILTSKGNILIMGSNPNLDRSNDKYATEYRVEVLDPPYMFQERPVIRASPLIVDFNERFEILFGGKSGKEVKVAIMDFGYATHGVHANSRLVWLRHEVDYGTKLSVTAPPNNRIYPPGPGWLFVVVDGVPSEGAQIMIGDGKDPAAN